MSDRNQKILRYLIKKGTVNKNKLITDLDLSIEQVTSSITALNQQLDAAGSAMIKLHQDKYYSRVQDLRNLYNRQQLNAVIFTPAERTQILIILLLTNETNNFLDGIAIDLHVSKNTALNDIKRLKRIIETNDLGIQFERKTGYNMIGDEWTKRIKLLQAIATIYKHYGEQLTTALLAQWQSFMGQTHQKIQGVEQYLGIKYTDEDFYSLIYFVSAILIRIENGHLVDGTRFDDREDIEQTREYQALFYESDWFSDLPSVEKAYVALHFLSANIRNHTEINDVLSVRLSNVLWEVLVEFETHTLIIIPNKKDLLLKLVNHFTPSYYRIKYHIPVNNVLYDKIKSNYEVLHNFVRQSITPLENLFGTQIADEEIAYITLFIGGHLVGNETNNMEEKMVKAVILCPNGVSMSKLLAQSLRATFPEFMFYPPSSVRDYPGFLLPHDLVFSTVPIESNKKVYVISDILNKNDQIKLRQTVLQDVFKVDFTGVAAKDILQVVKQYAQVSDEHKLITALNGLLVDQSLPHTVQTETDVNQVNLIDCLNPHVIAVRNGGSWSEVLEQAVDMLMTQGIVDKVYRNAVMREYHDKPSYVMLKQNIVLPHLDPDLFMQKLGVSLVVIRKGIEYATRRIHVVALLATPDKVSHLNVLYDINRLAQDDDFIKRLAQLNNHQEVLQAISLFFHHAD